MEIGVADGVKGVFQDDKVHDHAVFYEHAENLKLTVRLRYF